MAWRDILPVHPAADLLPLLKPDELAALAADIKKNGLRERPILWREPDQDYLLDGRNRLDALELNGATFLTKDKDGSYNWHDIWPTVELSPTFPPDVVPQRRHDPVDVVISANIMRRHLPFAEQERIVAELLKLYPERSDRQVAATVGVSHPTVGKVRRRLEKAGDVVTLTTSKDTRGRVQPRRRPPTARPHHMATAAPVDTSPAPAPAIPEVAPDRNAVLALLRAIDAVEAVREQFKPAELAEAVVPKDRSRMWRDLRRAGSFLGSVALLLEEERRP
jgi:DNA-binding Lrp family transcriptional regulator